MKTQWIAGAVLLCCAAQTDSLNRRTGDQNRPAYSKGKGTFPMTETASGQETGTGRKLLPVETLAQDVSAFALDLYHQLRWSEGDLFHSPYGASAALAMAMAHAGARGNTETQMASALRYTLPQESLHPAFAELGSGLAKLQEGGYIKLSTANSVWPQQGYPLLDGYLSLIKRHYGVSVTPLHYRDAPEAARETINRWVENRTAGGRKRKFLMVQGFGDGISHLPQQLFKAWCGAYVRAQHHRIREVTHCAGELC